MISVEGVTNFRDQGGYDAGGGKLAFDIIYRSGHFADITPNGQQQVQTLGLDVVIDLRDDFERQGFPSPKLDADVLHRGGDFIHAAIAKEAPPVTQAEVRDRKFAHYRLYPSRLHRGVAALFEGVASGHKVHVHCTAGKDRTGFVCATLLKALGVAEGDIRNDYMISQRETETMDPARSEAINKFYGFDQSKSDMVDLRRRIFPDLISEALAEVDRAYGSVEDYLLGPCGLSEQSLRNVHEQAIGEA